MYWTQGLNTRGGYERTRFIAAGVILVLVIAATSYSPDPAKSSNALTYFLLYGQDAWLVPLFVGACLLGPQPVMSAWRWPPRSERRTVWLLLALATLLCWAGHYLVFSGYDLSRDEQLVAFDAGIFRRGALVWPIAPEWRPLANALNRKFMLPIGAAEAWVSAYLPVNAAFHAAVGLLFDENLTSPLMVGAGGLFLWRIGLRLWPDSPAARAAALALYVGSSQILVTGMTRFAMSAHMALNLAWLWLFLRDRRGSHALAMAVAFLATGLHQPLFHPMFALPFLALLAIRRRWALLGAYAVAYACIGVFWLAWPLVMSSFGTGPLVPITTTAGASYYDRLLSAIQGPGLEGAWLTSANLVRFVTWQHPLLMPLAFFGGWAAWRGEPLVKALAVSAVLPLIVLWLLLPWQGNGWGYRYIHPAIGSVVLLGGWGWYALERRGLTLQRPMLWTTAAAVLVLLPIHGWMARSMVAPFAETDRSIGALDADIAIIDGHVSDDFVHNRHDLSNRPIRLFGPGVRPGQIAALCARGSLVFVDPAPPFRETERQQRLKAAAEAAGCETTIVRLWAGRR